MNSDFSNDYQKLCLKNNLPVNEFIISCLNDVSVNGELNLKHSKISDISCSLVADILKRRKTIRVLNLADCLLSFDGLKYFLNTVNQLDRLSVLNLKGNQIGNNITLYVAKILLGNVTITELRLDWNKLGDSVDTFAELCNSLLLNTVLTSLNLSNNNLCQNSSFYLAKLLNTNSCLKNIDLSWNHIGETGAVLLLKSLKNNNTLITLNIQGNNILDETTEMIIEQLKQNEINQKHTKNRNMDLFKLVTSADKNHQTQMTSLNYQYQNQIDELQSKLRLLQKENQQKQQELDEMNSKNTKEKENNKETLNKVEKIESELSFQKKSFNSLIKKISNEVSTSDMEVLDSLEDFEKVIFIIKRIKKRCTSKIQKETTANKRLVEETFPKLTNEVNTLKSELKNLKTSTDIEIKNYIDELKVTKELLDKKIDNEASEKQLIEKKFLNASDEMSTMSNELNNKINDLQKEKKDLEIKLEELEKRAIDTKIVRELENSLNLAKDELNKFNEKQSSTMAAQNLEAKLSTDTFNREIDALKLKLNEKEKELQFCKTQKLKMSVDHKTELSKLEEQLHLEKIKFIEKRKENQKLIEDLYFIFTQQIDKLRKENMDVSNYEKS